MERYIYNEKNGLWYELQGDYYLPCLKLSKEETAHIGVADKLDADEVVSLTFLEIGDLPEGRHRMDKSVIAVTLSQDLNGEHLPIMRSRGEIIDNAERILPVHSDESGEDIEAKFILKIVGDREPLILSHNEEEVIALFESSIGVYF